MLCDDPSKSLGGFTTLWVSPTTTESACSWQSGHVQAELSANGSGGTLTGQHACAILVCPVHSCP